MSAPRGLTLVEILTALFVLAVGLGSVMAIVVRSANMGSFASDRNNASILITEAVEDIKHMMLIGDREIAAGLPESARGEMMDTMGLGTAANPYNNIVFYDINFNNTTSQNPTPNNTQFQFQSLAYKNGSQPTDLAYWPFSVKYSRTLGMFPTPVVLGGSASGDSMYNKIGIAYRALWKLTPHVDWVNPATRVENPDSAYAGVYVLTIALYRDLESAKALTDSKPKRLEQISDPVVLQVHDKKVRK